ncbi:MAG: beta-ketoacyl synthase N-terminal-like domain-containing protein [Cyanobacteria bacterium P01_H01_bin.15]
MTVAANTGLEIAIIGLAGKFPGASTVTEFWQNLIQGVESIAPLTDEHLLAQGVSQKTLADPNYIKVGGKLEDSDRFDANFFGFSPREAALLDPQQRLFLETAWTVLETAGYGPGCTQGSVGVYGGAGMNGYLLNLYGNPEIRDSVSPYELFVSNDKDFLTTRVSYKLNLEGPSLAVQTACSSSLVAVHLACQALLSGECDLALAGGVAVSKQLGYRAEPGSIYAADGHCRAFDAQAEGTVGGNGVGIVVLKRLEDAIADGDTIDAIIKGSAINNDGNLKVSYTAPRIEGQREVIQAALAMAEVEPESIGYIEAHGTGTALGDPIEIASLTQAFNCDRRNFCALGSVKTNIGHLDAAAGIAGLIKTVLALKHRQIPASLHYQSPNPKIEFDQSPVYVNAELADWASPENTPRRAGVSSFGIGGSNAHVILEEAPAIRTSASENSNQPQVLLLSAKTPSALDTAATDLHGYLKQSPDVHLADAAYTLQLGRQGFSYRRSLVARNCKTAQEKLSVPYVSSPHFESPSLVFLFPGQSSQYSGMGRLLYQTQPVFRETINQCADILADHLEVPLLELLGYSDQKAHPALTQTQNTQPAIFAVEYALAKLWQHWSLQPVALLGHSLGEYVAACLASVFELPAALELISLRGRLMQQQPTGAMLSVMLPAAELSPLLSDELTLAATNAPQLTAVSGTESAITNFQTKLDALQINWRRLHTSHGFHSPMMDPVVEPLATAVSKFTLQAPSIPFISNITGTWITPEQATDPAYWGQQARQAVRFTEGITEILGLSEPVLLEVGPGQTLTTLTRQQFTSREPVPTVNSLPHPKTATTQPEAEVEQLMTAAGQLWSAGVDVDWAQFHPQPRRRIPLPTYPFERQRYWVDLESTQLNSTVPHETEIQPLEKWFYVPSWKRQPQFTTLRSHPTERPVWILFADEQGLGESLGEQIEQAGQDLFAVRRGEGFEQLGYREFSVNPSEPDSYQALWSDLAERELTPTNLVYAWGLDQEAAQTQFMTLLNLFRTWSGQSGSPPLSVAVLSSSAFEVMGTENLQSEQAVLGGLCQVVSQEYPAIGCRQVDVELDHPKLAKTLWQNLNTSEPVTATAFRGSYPWAQTFEALTLGEESVRKRKLKSGGTYAVVGPLDPGVGLVWAESLAKHHQVNLVLLQPTDAESLPNSHWLELGAAEVFSQLLDLTEPTTLANALQTAERKFGDLNGIFWSSPTTNEQSAAPIALMTPEHWHYNARTKLKRLQALISAITDFRLDFCCVQSSLAAVIGGVGLAAYASANQGIDALVAAQNLRSQTPWYSVNWDAVTEGATPTSGWGNALQAFALTPEEVWQATERILNLAPTGQVVVSKGDLTERIAQWIHTESRQAESVTGAASASSLGHERPALATVYVAPRNEVESKIAAIWSDLLGIDKVGVDDSFFDLGGHSLLAIQVISRLREAFPVTIEMRNLLFNEPTIAGIAAVIAKQLPKEEELDTMAALLAEVQGLSSEEVQTQLGEDKS